MIANLAMDFASIQSKEYADKLAADGHKELLNQQPVGTGPFQFVAYQKDAVIRYKANPDYWAGKAAIDDLIYAITTDPAVRYQKLKANECQVMPYPNPADLEAMRKDPDIQLLQQEGLNVGYLAYNTQQKPFDNAMVRKALNMAINKQSILDAVFQGAGTIAKNPIPPTMWSYNKSIKDDPYDPAAAKKMLDEAGVKDLHMKIWAMPVQRPYNPNARRMAELIQADFAKVGVTAEIVSYEWAEYLKLSKDVKHDGAVLLGWTGDNGDPDNFLAVLLGCAGVGGSEPRRVVLQAVRGSDPKGPGRVRPRRADQALRAGAGGVQGAGAMGDDRPFGGVHAAAQGSDRLQDQPLRRPRLLRRRYQAVAPERKAVRGVSVPRTDAARIIANRASMRQMFVGGKL